MFKMNLEKWMFLIIILTKAKCNGCPINDTAFGWIGSSPVFNYTADMNEDGTFGLFTPKGVNLFRVSYAFGQLQPGTFYNTCSLAVGGSLSVRLLNIKLDPLQTGQEGTYKYQRAAAVLKCITLYMYGVPTQPAIVSSATVAYEGQTVVLTCISTSTTVPSGHNLKMTYEWRRDGVTLSSGGRFTLEPTTGIILTISNINRYDDLYRFSCRATEQGGNTSVLSVIYNLIVGYGPDLARLSPSEASYTLNENQPLNNITCSADCNPACTYVWTKSGGGTVSITNGVFSLGSLHKSEAGTYWCTASNAARSVNSSTVTINVNYGPDWVRLSPSYVSYSLNENQPLNDITCSAACYPACTYVWTKSDGGTVSTTYGVLSLEIIHRSEAGTYWCTALNAAGSVNSSNVTINVNYGPDTVTLSPSNTSYTINERESINDITCTASCSPGCTYTWTKPGGVSNTNVLSLGTLQREEAGNYRCSATNPQSAASVNSESVIVVVRYGPDSVNLTSPSLSYTLNENQLLNDITCSATCSPVECAYQWTKSGGGSVSDNSVLSLRTLQRGESGNYTCTARNPGSAVTASSQKIGVFVRYGPDDVTLSVSSEYTVVEGQVAPNIRCSSDCWPECKYTWKNKSSGTSVSSTEVFIIGQVNRYAAGSYTCMANNPGSSQIANSTTKLVVNYAPNINIYISSTNPTEGQPLDLTCEASGVPASYTFTSLTQTHSGAQIPNTHIKLGDPTSISTRIVSIPELRMDDTGTYNCSVQNGVPDVSGRLQQTAATKLMVKGSPKVLTNTLKIAAATGANASLSIPVYAYPILDEIVLQRYDGLNISRSSETHILLRYNTTVVADWYGTKVRVDGTLLNFTIINLQPVDFGNYTLSMKNAVAVSSAVLTVVAESKPSSPAALNFTVIHISVFFTWKRGFNGGHSQTFIVQLSKDSSDNYIENHTISEEARIDTADMVTLNITIRDAGVYHARLLTFNAIGAAEPVMFGVFTIEKVSDETESTSSASTAAIAGGIIGSLCGIMIIVLVVVAVMRYEIKCVRRQALGDGHGIIRQNETTLPSEGNGTDLNNQAYETLDVDQGKAIYTSLSQQAVHYVYSNSEDNAGKAVYMNTSFETV